MERFIDSIVPAPHSDVLVIAGDLGHYNNQNTMMLQSFKRYYKYILIVCGNHDLYLISNKQRNKYAKRSAKRWIEMKQLASDLGNVIVLEGDTVTIDGITFGGTGMWYDYSYGIKEMNQSHEAIHELWLAKMNDNYFIRGIPSFTEEYKKLERVFEHSEVIVTHVGPDWSELKANYQSKLLSSFYYFDGSDLVSRAAGKVWCFGHTHDHYSYVKDGCLLINNALGYPGDNPGAKIKTVDLGIAKPSNTDVG